MKRSSGVLMHISSLWGDYSIGSFGDAAKEWIDFLADAGFSYWQTLPFCLPDEMNSPYKSFSAFSGNPYFIDLPQLEKQGLLTQAELRQAKQETPYACEFKRLKYERIFLLNLAASRFYEWEKVDAFLEAHPHTEQFCQFMALKAANFDKPWQEWTVSTPDEETLRNWRFNQYIFYTQWMEIRRYAESKQIKIIGDIPIYVDIDSADVWAAPEQFQLDEGHQPKNVAGVPPDYFSEDGQLWGNPLYNWNQMKKDGFAWWKERLQFMTELFDGVRIDHFRAFESYFSIPATETSAKNGKWIKGPGMSFIKAVKDVCKDKLIIAEDLGDITEAVKELVTKSGFPGMRVFQFAFLGDPQSPHLPHNYISNSVSYTGTHDNNTLLGYVWGDVDDETRRRMLSYCGYEDSDWDKGYDSILRTMMASHSGMVIFPVQDLLLYGSDTRMNKPGLGEGNWSYRVAQSQMREISAEKFLNWNLLYGRK